MRSTQMPLLALVAAATVAGQSTGHAETPVPPYVPPAAAVKHYVPPQVSAAVVVLREACAAWRRAAVPIASGSIEMVPTSQPPAPPPPERTLCVVADDPDWAFMQSMIFGGVVGAFLFFIGLLVFSLLRAVLISVWNWRLPTGAKSW